MPTGPAHQKLQDIDDSYGEVCRCLVGADHLVDDDTPVSEALSAGDADDIWLSSGMDEDYDMR